MSPKQQLANDENSCVSPYNIRVEKQDLIVNQPSQEDDVSAIDLSQKSVDIQNIKAALALTIKEGKIGNAVSRSIMDEVDPRVLDKLSR